MDDAGLVEHVVAEQFCIFECLSLTKVKNGIDSQCFEVMLR